MKVITAHKERIGEMQSSLDRLFALHRELFGLRSKSWYEQSRGDLDRAGALDAIRQQIEGLEQEALDLRAAMIGPETPSPPEPPHVETAAPAIIGEDDFPTEDEPPAQPAMEGAETEDDPAATEGEDDPAATEGTE